ncbi:M3 family metallopeptidase [Flexithrix dorotheae]|uniref:M3 family metallopeptidase n=1 Tax=Flexithrix dorotheae TaxID=70993 RepID=UPI00036E852E|nr:M3 family metallopeptidase [Flexithrix dorotheae]
MNPLLNKFETPFETAPFHLIKEEHFLPAIKEAIAQGKSEIEAIKNNPEAPDFGNTIEALERSGALANKISTIFFNLNSAETNDEIQKLAREISPLLTEYGNDILLDQELFEKIKIVYQSKNTYDLTPEAATLLDKTYKSFVRNGANLSAEDKEKLREIDKRKAELSLEFGEHLLKETNAYKMVISDENELEGLPDYIKEAAAMTAKEKGEEGKWVFTLDYPSYVPFMTYAKNRARREELFRVFSTRGFKNDENDNREIVKEIANLRFKRANLLGYKTHADFVLEERMAESPEKVTSFLTDMLNYAKPVAFKEVAEVTEYATKTEGLSDLQRWDFSYYSEKLKKERFAINDEILKPYFKLENVIDGVFKVANKLFGLSFKENKEIPVYHKEVTAYEVENKAGEHVAVFYADFFPRKGKRAGAWMTSFRGQKKQEGKEQRPHVSIVCNFTKPTETKPSLLTFNEVTTLFHEFGHALHGMLANGTYESLSGTSVYWDFVELPSQVLENWAYEKECLDMFASHYETGEKIPEELIRKIKESSNFLGGYQTVRQISFGLLDMGWHSGDPTGITDVYQFETETIKETELFPEVEGSLSSCAFAHIFQGGYSSGYYSYKWAEVLDADAFDFFKEKGIFDGETALLFQKHVLSAGGSEHPMVLYKRFRGKEPSIKPLLKRTGLIPSEN